MKTLIAVMAIMSACASQAQTMGSLWNDDVRMPLYDRIARRPGDVLTVIISEVSSASSTASTQASKKEQTSIEAGLGPILRNLIPALGTGADFKSQGQGFTTRTGRLSARLTVVIKATLPSRNLIIEGTRYVQVNKETQKLVITGVIRPDDIMPDNTIFSEFIANADIRYDGKGTVGDRQRKGIITTLLDWLF